MCYANTTSFRTCDGVGVTSPSLELTCEGVMLLCMCTAMGYLCEYILLRNVSDRSGTDNGLNIHVYLGHLN